MIDAAEGDNPKFRKAAVNFLKQAHDTINPNVSAADVKEMLDPAHLDGRHLQPSVRRCGFPSSQQRGSGALRSGGNLLHCRRLLNSKRRPREYLTPKEVALRPQARPIRAP
jgi:hypothetical protein